MSILPETIILILYCKKKREKLSQTKVKVKKNSVDETDIETYAKKVVKRSKYIQKEWTYHVQKLILELFNRQVECVEYDVSIDELDDYLELLYGCTTDETDTADIKQKINGSSKILQLLHNMILNEESEIDSSTVLYTMVENHALVSALSRVYEEDSKKSNEIAFITSKIFLYFSSITQLHGLLTKHRIGSITIDLITLLVIRRKHHRLSSSTSPSKEDHILNHLLNILFNLSKQSQKTEIKMLKKNLISILSHCLVSLKSRECLITILYFFKKLSIYKENIDQILSLTEMKDLSVVNCGGGVVGKSNYGNNENNNTTSSPSSSISVVVERLLLLTFTTNDTQVIRETLGILFNFSFDERFRQQLACLIIKENPISKNMRFFLPRLVSLLKNNHLRSIIIKLLYNLSCDGKMRRVFSMSTGVDSDYFVFHTITKFITNFPPKPIPKELAALLINITLDPVCAERLLLQYDNTNNNNKGQGQILDMLIFRIEQYDDYLLAKALCNLSMYTNHLYHKRQKHSVESIESGSNESKESIPNLWDSKRIPKVIDLCLNKSDNHDILFELLGTLCNVITCNDMAGFNKDDNESTSSSSLSNIILQYRLTTFLGKYLMPGMAENNIIVQIIILCRLMCVDNKCAWLLVRRSGNATTTLMTALIEVWRENKKTQYYEPEIDKQMILTIYKFLQFEETRDELLRSKGK